MRVALVTLCLNEKEFLLDNFQQHIDWPGLVSWVFVEAADVAYKQASPNLVTEYGLSVDGTTESLQQLHRQDSRVRVVHHGFMSHTDPTNAKIIGRNRCLQELDEIEPDLIIQIDADEFYSKTDQKRINELVWNQSGFDSWRLQQRHLWAPPALTDAYAGPLLEVQGGYWKVEHVRLFRWQPGIECKTNHNWPETNGVPSTASQYRFRPDDPQCIHYGFAKSVDSRAATHRYYEERGEGKEQTGRNRQSYVDCRRAWETWVPGRKLPYGAHVIPYDGTLPECFLAQ